MYKRTRRYYDVSSGRKHYPPPEDKGNKWKRWELLNLRNKGSSSEELTLRP